MKNKFRESRWFDLAVAGLVTVTVPLVAFLGWPLISKWTAATPKGPVLIYEIDPALLPPGTTVDMEQLAEAVDRRVNSGSSELAKVRLGEDRRIEVALMRNNDADLKRVEHLLSHTATLDFRILANDWNDKPLIERARADPSKVLVVDGKGKLLARWVPVKSGQEASLADYKDIARRTKKVGQREVTEVLVVKDDEELNGTYLKRIQKRVDTRGQASLAMTFNTRGGQLCRSLTASHQPKKGTDRNFKLGVIINGELYAAPLIVSTIYDYAQIGGSFDKRELDDLVSRMNTGSLPARVRLAEKKDPP